jgi:peptidoglycan/LPS O-acetylase OafA/YrhL
MALDQLLLPAPPKVPAPARPRPISPAQQPPPVGPVWLQGGSIPALDGLRALSIGMVLLAHASLTWNTGSGDHRSSLVRLGSIGVDLFFAISGFLITLLLLREHRKHGRISLRAFYVRRAWRILPAYCVFLAFLGALSAVGLVQLIGRDWAGALTYTVNFLPGTSWPVGHLWSLSVEEHFYLFWPLLLLVLGPGRACCLAAVYVVAAPLVRLVLWKLGNDHLDIDYCTPARIDTIAVGCLLAYLTDRAATRRVLSGLRHSGAATLFAVLLAALIVSNTVLIRSGIYAITVHRTVDAVCFAGIIWAGASHTSGPLAAVLNAAPLVWVGRLSYGLYLWQQPMLNPHADHWACRWPINLALAILAACVSFVLVERPALRLREKRGLGKV